MALGKKIGDERGKVTSTRVLETTPVPKIETTFEGRGNLLGVEGSSTGTYFTVIHPNGTFYGEGNGIIRNEQGIVTWKGSGVAKVKPSGAASYRGAIYYETKVERLLELNGMACVFEYEVDEDGHTKAEVFEWK